jgi:hypothetical protein
MRKQLLFLLFFLSLPVFSDFVVKDAETFGVLPEAYYEIYSYPDLILKELGFSDENGSVFSNISTDLIFVFVPNYESYFGTIINNTNQYMTYLQQAREIVDSECGIPCNSDTLPEEGGRSLTEDCSCVCNSVCPRNTVQDDDCRCVFPVITNPLFIENVSLYSQMFVQSRVLSVTNGDFSLVRKPNGCEIVVYSDVNSTGKILKTMPCVGSLEGKIMCSFSIDDLFYSESSYSARIKCGMAERSFNFNVLPSRQINILNTLVSWTQQKSSFVGYFVLIIAGVLVWRLLK